MANTLKMKGTFGMKQTFNVASTYSTTTGLYAPDATWYAGYLFGIGTASTSIADAIVVAISASGSAVMGCAMEDSADATTAVAGMAQPSGSKVTLLHGHSVFEIVNGSTTKCYEQGSTLGNMESASLMDLVYASAAGKWTDLLSDAASGAQTNIPPLPLGFVTKAPTAANSYTFGISMFG